MMNILQHRYSYKINVAFTGAFFHLTNEEIKIPRPIPTTRISDQPLLIPFDQIDGRVAAKNVYSPALFQKVRRITAVMGT